MALFQDLLGLGSFPAEAAAMGDRIRLVNTFTGGADSTASTIGGIDGETILEFQGSSGAALTFLSTTPFARWYTLENTGSNAVSIFCPIGSSFQTSTASVATISVGGVNFIFRAGKVGANGSVASDRWVFK